MCFLTFLPSLFMTCTPCFTLGKLFLERTLLNLIRFTTEIINYLDMVLTRQEEIHLLVFFNLCFTVSIMPSINTFESSNDFMILIISFISSFEMNKVILFLDLREKYSCVRQCGWQEKFSPGRPQLFFLTKLIEFFKWSLRLKTTWTALFFFDKQRALSFIVQREKTSVNPNKLPCGKPSKRWILLTERLPLWI